MAKQAVQVPTKGKTKFVMPEKKTKAEGGGGMNEEKLLAKYPHAIKGTLRYDEEHRKNSIEANLECGHRARVFTSDLFQVKRCPACRKAKSSEKLAELKGKSEKKASVPAKSAKLAKAAPAPATKSAKPAKAAPADEFVDPKTTGKKRAIGKLLE